jgi:uncharacterized membrane protein YeaQ/YmgE (transglycosylase-associated protein family)
MNLVVWLVVGGLLGWTANTVLTTQRHRGLAMSIMVGVAGSVLAGWLVGSLAGGAPSDDAKLSAMGLVASIAGSISLLAIMNLVKRRTASY